MKYIRHLIFACIFLLFLAFGFHLGTSWGQAAGIPLEESTKTSTDVSTGNTRQHNVLIIGINQIKSSTRRLESLWLLIYYTNSSRVDLIPIFPRIGGESQGQDKTLIESFDLTTDGQPEKTFLEQVNARDILWHHYVVVDKVALNAIIDFIELSDPHNHGRIQLVSSTEDSLAAIQSQTAVLAQLCQCFKSNNLPADITPFVGNLSPYLSTDIPLQKIDAGWRMLRAYGNNLHCEFPTLTP